MKEPGGPCLPARRGPIAEEARLLALPVSEFVLDRAVADAEHTVETRHTIRLDATGRRRFLAALDSPSLPPKELLDQVRKARSIEHAD